MRTRVAIGRKYPERHTQYFVYATREPLWHPQSDPNAEPDYDELRKQDLESETK